MYLYLILPIFCVYIVTFFNPMKKNNKTSPYQPPGWIFGIVWPILLILVGYSWKLRPKLTPYYSLLTFLLSSLLISKMRIRFERCCVYVKWGAKHYYMLCILRFCIFIIIWSRIMSDSDIW